MPVIYSYQKFITTEITRELRLPVGAEHRPIGTELATLADGLTYVCLPDGAVLPDDQPAEIKDSIQPVTLNPTLSAEMKAASPHVRLINSRVAEKIAEHYSMADEIKLLRTAPSQEFEAYNAHTEECRAWGRAEKSRLGL